MSATTLAAIDAYIEEQMQANQIPGLALGLADQGKPLCAKGYGMANLEHNVPATAQTIYQSASVGKQFTAAAILLLAEADRLAIDDPIAQHLPTSPASWDGITIRHLLTHTSGIANYTKGLIDYRRDYTEEELFGLAAESALDFAPGSAWRYSNTGYLLLGQIIERVSGQFYGDFLRAQIFGPVGMTTTQVNDQLAIIPGRASGYEVIEGVLRQQRYVSPSLNRTADGSLLLSVADLLAWDAALNRGDLLTPSSYAQMWSPVTLSDGSAFGYGFGWDVKSTPAGRLVQHSGHWQGFSTHIARYLDRQVTVIVLSNLGGQDTSKVAHAVAALHDPALQPAA